mmetsp:Transcript_5348/g.12279  ORF Transcript_5348/g.12279 Transcript_5348/m.12279 type:complete len:181 (+) Transcript_5348:26-568(+)
MEPPCGQEGGGYLEPGYHGCGEEREPLWPPVEPSLSPGCSWERPDGPQGPIPLPRFKAVSSNALETAERMQAAEEAAQIEGATEESETGAASSQARQTPAEDQAILHLNGQCTPCLFFTRKADGCRKGDACEHCHLCTAEEARKRRNRMVLEARKAQKKRSAPVTVQRLPDGSEKLIFDL